VSLRHEPEDDFLERHERASRAIAVNWFIAGFLAGSLVGVVLMVVFR
jgi:hypothetical protein